MKIALLGYGRMGKSIDAIAVKRGHEISYKTSSDIHETHLKLADVAIDFSIPSAAYHNITTCFKLGVPVVSGTTGWLEDYDKAVTECHANSGAFIYASNFSIGVNLFFKLNKTLATLMANQTDYSLSLTEIHHTKKLDAPSGTAISLAEQIIDVSPKESWVLKEKSTQKIKDNEVPITAIREPNIPGTHSIAYDSNIDSIEIKHTAHSREGFALGAVIAAEWLLDKTGVFTMKDVLKTII